MKEIKKSRTAREGSGLNGISNQKRIMGPLDLGTIQKATTVCNCSCFIGGEGSLGIPPAQPTHPSPITDPATWHSPLRMSSFVPRLDMKDI